MRTPAPTVEIAGMGRFLPERVVTNVDLEATLETSDEWIRERTGIRERRIASEDVRTSDLGASAANQAMAEAGVEPGEVDLLVVSTATPDRWLPSTACEIQAKLGATNALAFDLHAACTGWLYGLSMAEGYLTSGRGEISVVVAAEKMSSIVDWADRSTCVLFGDGGGAAVVRQSADGSGILSSHLRSDGRLADLLHRPAGGAAQPLDPGSLAANDHMVHMSGREIFRNAVRNMTEACDVALQSAGLTPDDVDLLVPHQANIRIIEATAKYAGVDMERVFVNVDRYGNMSSASIPVALSEAEEQGRLPRGANVLTTAFGAGLTWGSMAIRW